MPKNFKLLLVFILSLLPLRMNQFGFPNCERLGLLIFEINWIGFTAVLSFIVSTLILFKNRTINTVLGLYGVVGMVVAELTAWYSWYAIPEVALASTRSIESAMKYCLPTFYLGLAISVLMVIYYISQTFSFKKK